MAQALVLTLLETGRSSEAAIAAEASVLIKTEGYETSRNPS